MNALNADYIFQYRDVCTQCKAIMCGAITLTAYTKRNALRHCVTAPRATRHSPMHEHIFSFPLTVRTYNFGDRRSCVFFGLNSARQSFSEVEQSVIGYSIQTVQLSVDHQNVCHIGDSTKGANKRVHAP